MESGRVLEESWRETGPKTIADALGVSLSLVYKWSAPPTRGGVANPLDRVRLVVKSTGNTKPVEWLCREANGYFVPNPKPDSGDQEALLTATQSLVGRFADLLNSIADAAAESGISREEAVDIREVWDCLKSHAEGFVRTCESGAYHRPERTSLGG